MAFVCVRRRERGVRAALITRDGIRIRIEFLCEEPGLAWIRLEFEFDFSTPRAQRSTKDSTADARGTASLPIMRLHRFDGHQLREKNRKLVS
jgi:hypothetical protein